MKIPEKVLLFRLKERFYAIPCTDDRISGIIKDKVITPLPEYFKNIKGACYFKGRIIPVFSTSMKLGYKEDVSSSTIIVVKNDKGLTGLAVDEVEDILDSSILNFKKVILKKNNIISLIEAAGEYKNEPVFLIDTEKLIKNDTTFNIHLEDIIIKKRKNL